MSGTLSTTNTSNADAGHSATSGSKKKRGNKGRSTVSIDDTDNLLIPGRAECECQGNNERRRKVRGELW